MDMYNNRWIRLTLNERGGFSYVRIQDIYRIAVNKSVGLNGDRYSVTVFANGTEFGYSRDKELEEANADCLSLLELATSGLSQGE